MILIVDMNYKKNSLAFYEFVLPIAAVVQKGYKFEIVHFTELTERFNTLTYDSIILSGTTLKDMEFSNHIESFEWLKSYEKPVLGICAGMQIIGLVFDSSLIACQEMGMTEVYTLKENPLFSSRFMAYELHNYALDSSDELEIIAASKECAQSIKHRHKTIYGVLFHPEVRNPSIIEDFLRLH